MSKRSIKKMSVFRPVLNGACEWLPPHMRRTEYFARLRKKHAPGYMKLLASRGAKATNAKRAAAT